MKSLLLSATKKGTELPVGGTQLKVKDIALIGMMSSIMIAAQVCLNFLPNVELVSLLIILYTLIFGWKSLYMIYIFVAVEGLLYGFSLWWFSYLYIWLVLYLITKLFHKVTSPLYWAIISGIYGLSFGALYSIVVVLTSGINGGLASWVQGIPFDIAHGIGNFAVTLILFKPLYFILSKLNRQSEY